MDNMDHEVILARLAGALAAKRPGSRCWSDGERIFIRYASGWTQTLYTEATPGFTQFILDEKI